MNTDELREFQSEVASQMNKVLMPVCETLLEEEIMLKTDDGEYLRTIIIKDKKADKPLPTIVVRSCYPSQGEKMLIQLREFARRGFACVLQWCRGTGGSSGKWEPYFNEREDGFCLMNWLDKQPWIKNIGLTGGSYLALVHWIIGDCLPEKVKTMYLTVLGTQWHTSLWQEGSFRQDVYTSWLMNETTHDKTMDYMASAAYRPQINVDEALWHKRSDVYRDFISHPSKDDDYWNTGYWKVLKDIPEKLDIPIYIGEGFYDIHLQNMLDTYTRLSKVSKAHSVVEVNPGNHGRNPVIPFVEKQDNAKINNFESQISWFKTILMDEKLPDPSVDFYLINADKWCHFKDYPIKADEYYSLYLDGHSLMNNMGEESLREYDYDPLNPVESYGSGTLFKISSGVGMLRQPDPDYRSDVLSYISDPIKEDMDIIGRIKAELYVQSDAKDTCFTFKLMEVREDGSAYNIRDGITTLAYRNKTGEKLSYNNDIIKVEIEGWEIAYRVKKGSRLRVDISSSNFPEYSVHPNTDVLWSYEQNPVTAHQKVYAGNNYPSRIILPICKEYL